MFPDGATTAQQAPLLIETSPTLLNLIERAQEGAERADWKLAADSLQRVIEDPTGSLIPSASGATQSGVLYESARRYARRMLGELPDEGLRAYRLVYDGRARGMLERARASHDVAGLRTVVDRFLLTSVGDDAADLLASWLLDEGRAGEALSVLLDSREFIPDADVPEERTGAKIVAAYAMLGRMPQAESDLQQLKARLSAKGDVPAWLDEVAQGAAWVQNGERLARRGEGVRGAPLTVNQVPQRLIPAVQEATPWKYDLPGGVENLWQRIFDEDAQGPPQLPLAELATDGERVFVRKRGGCVALWPDDLSTIWQVELSTDAESARQSRPVDVQLLLGNRTPQPIEDDAPKLISTAAGLALVVEPGGTGEFRDTDSLDEIPAEFGAHATGATTSVSSGTRLVALDSATGEIRWHRGRTGIAADVLGDVQFTSAPIAVGENLWVAYFRRNDFFVAVLRPDDGAVLRNILLGSVQGGERSRRFVTPLAAGDGAVYVASGYGTLFALGETDFSLRWAAQYRQLSGGPADPQISSGWISSAPVSTGGLVLLAPTDHRELLAFGTADGSFAWAIEPADSSYILAATPDRVWLAGRGVSCHAVSDGRLLWHTQLEAAPTGRGALTGDAILLPTAAGLAQLAAQSGDYISTTALVPNQLPLGNLLSVDPAVFSLDPSSVRRFPDVARSHRLALARYEADPQDARAGAQLAWAELLSGNTARAREITDQFLPVLAGSDSLAEGLRRVRIESLLRQADKNSDHEESLALLDLARQAARHAEQNIRVRLAVADRLRTMGRNLDSHRVLFELGLEADSDRTVAAQDAVEISIRSDLARRLRELRPLLSTDELRAVDAEVAERIAGATQRVQNGDSDARRELMVIAELDPTGTSGQYALYVLAERELSRQRYEWAEQYLRECIRRDPQSDVALSANIKLCEMYGPPWQDSAMLLEPCLDELEARFAGRPVPPDPRLTFGHADDAPQGSSGQVAEWVAGQRAGLSQPRVSPGIPVAAPGLRLTGERLWSYGFEPGPVPPRMVEFRNGASAAVAEAIVLLGTDDTLECLDAKVDQATDKPRHLWRTELRLPGSFDIPRPIGFRELQQSRLAAADGQIAVFNAVDGLFGVGLVTGRRLWARAFDSPLAADLVPYRDTLVAAADGYVAAMPRAGRLSLMRLVDGSPVWERDLRGEPVAHIWLEGNRVLTADAAMQRLHIVNRVDGTLVAQRFFRQPDVQAGLVQLIRAGGIVCGPDSTSRSDALVGISLETGQEVWRAELGKPVVQLFQPEPGRIGAGLLGGDVRILNAEDGEMVLDRRYSKGLPIVDAVLVDGTLIGQAERRHGQLRIPELVALDVATGEEVWTRTDLAGLQEPAGPMAYVNGTIAALVDSTQSPAQSGRGAPAQRPSLSLTMIDVKTGADSGPAVELPAASSGTRVNRDLVIRSGMVVVGSNRAVQAFRLEPTTVDAKHGS